jgi:hypothetical protein
MTVPKKCLFQYLKEPGYEELEETRHNKVNENTAAIAALRCGMRWVEGQSEHAQVPQINSSADNDACDGLRWKLQMLQQP